MASTSNVPINSRSMNGVITISDGIATLENGDLTCDDINSDTLTTNNLNSNVFTCNGEFRSNLVGPYTIPTFTSSLTGSLFSYGNTLNSGATDFTNYGSTYNLLKQGFYFNNINSTTTLTNLAIIDNSQTYFKSQLVGCTAETPLNTTSIVNKTYCDSNFVDRTNNLTQDINGLKTFTNNMTIYSPSSPTLTVKVSSGTTQQGQIRMSGSSFQLLNNSTTPTIVFILATNTRLTVSPTQFLLDSTCFLTTNDMKSRAPTLAHTLLSDITTGSLVISSSTATNTINGATQLNQQTTFNNFTPISSIATPTAVNHLTRKDYVDNNFLDRTNNLTQNINGLKTFINSCNFTSTLFLRTNLRVNDYGVRIANTINLSFPLEQTIIFAPSSGTSVILNLPIVTSNEIGMIFTFYKRGAVPFDVTINVTSPNVLYLSSSSSTFTTNTTLLSQDKLITRLAVGNLGSNIYWIEISDYSIFDRNQNNLIYPRLTVANVFTNTNTFSAQVTFNNFTPICSVATPTANNHLVRKDYVDNNFVNLTSDQIIGGKKTFTVDITAHNLNVSAGLYILDLINISNPNNSRIFHQGTTLNFQPNANYSNNYYFYCNGYPYVRFSENFTALDCNTSVSTGKLFYTNNISPNDGTATQSIYTGLTSGTINIGSSSSYCNINSLSTFSKLLTVENLDLSYTGDAYINCPNATGLSLFLALTTQTIGLFSNLTTAIVNFCSSSVFTTMFNLNARIKHKQTQILNEVKHITGTSETLTFPLEQTLMLSATGSSSIVITLPLLNSSHHAGFTFNVIKTGSITNSVSFTASGSNLIRAYGGITGVSSLTQMAGTETIINIYTLEVSAGNFVWIFY